MLKNIVIIGAGQLGSRHLQAMKGVKESLNIEVIDQEARALTIARQRYDDIPGVSNSRIHYTQSFDTMPDSVDVAIISTSSANRKEAIVQLLEKTDVKYLVLEKILFQDEKDLYEVQQFIDLKKVETWVNCPMRMMPFYKLLKSEFNNQITYQISGSNFGLVTNLIHYLDFIGYLVGCNDFSLDTKRIDKELVPSKRDGYMELNGTISASFIDGSVLEVTCLKRGDLPFFSQIFNQHKRVLINEFQQKAFWTSYQDRGKLCEVEAKIPYQSELTTILVEQLLRSGCCDLPTYQESMKTHIIMMKSLTDFINEFTEYKGKSFPFT